MPELPGSRRLTVMDPVCHTLVGASLAETGLKRRTALGAATLLIGANLPDVDVLAYFVGPTVALSFRRGVTHGVLALLVLPLLLTGLILLWDTVVRRRSKRGADPPEDVVPSQVLFLAFISVLTHPTLDFLNVYGMRWLMPFSDRWFYGDTLFIVDPWIWGMLAAGIYLARQRLKSSDRKGGRWAGRPAAAALVGLTVYAVIMAGSNLAARRYLQGVAADEGIRLEGLMVSPQPVNPFVRRVVMEDSTAYRVGELTLIPRLRFQLSELELPKYPAHPAAKAALRETESRRFLSWARFPFFLVETEGASAVVHIGDARYTLDPENSWAAVSVPVVR